VHKNSSVKLGGLFIHNISETSWTILCTQPKYETKGKLAREGSACWPPTIQSSSFCDKNAYGVSQYSRT